LFGKELNNFQSDWNSTIINKPDLTQYALNSDINRLSTTLLINNLNATSTTLLNLMNYLTGSSTISDLHS
jgi:hypothetical protein